MAKEFNLPANNEVYQYLDTHSIDEVHENFNLSYTNKTPENFNPPSINEVWIHRHRQNQSTKNPQLVPEDLIDSAMKLTTVHGCVVNIYYDSSQCVPEALTNSKEFLENKRSAAEEQCNIEFKDLMDIPAYAQNIKMLRALSTNYNIIDISKFLILLNELVVNHRSGAVYIDKDRCSLHDKENKFEIWSQESKNKLDESGIILSDFEDNKYLQVANNEHIIKALIMATDTCLIASKKMVNNEFNLKGLAWKLNASAMFNVAVQFATKYIPKYFNALKNNTLSIRADLVGEGDQDQTVLYNLDKHNPKFRGNFFSIRMKELMEVAAGDSWKEATRPSIKFGEAEKSEPASIKINMRMGCDHQDEVNSLTDYHHEAVLWNKAIYNSISQEEMQASGENSFESYD